MLAGAMFFSGLPALAQDAGAAEPDSDKVILHVSTTGSDMNPGTEDRPLATLEGAKAAIRKMLKEKPIEVRFHAGEYLLEKTVEFTAADAGTEDAPITYTNAGDGEVIFNGAKRIDISQFKPVTDESILQRLPAAAAGRVGQIDMAQQGFTLEQMTPIQFDGMKNPYETFCKPQPLNLYLNDYEQQLAKWPNRNYAYIGNVVSNDTFEYTETNPSNWTKAKHAFVAGYLYLEYDGGWAKLQSVDTEKRTITVSGAESVKANHRWSVVNLLEELDIPGEWYVDRDTMIMYYYPEKKLDAKNDRLEFPVLRGSMFMLTDCPYVCFDGLTLAKGYGRGIELNRSSHVQIKNCYIRDMGESGIRSQDFGKDIQITGNTISNTGKHSISYQYNGYAPYPKEEYDNLVSTNVVISNNQCYNSGNNGIGMIGSIETQGIGTVVEHNTVHKGLNSGVIGVAMHGNTMRYNEVYNMVRETADAGAVYMGRTWKMYGSSIEYNYIHDLGDKEFNAGNLVDCIFWDDTGSGQTARYNILRPNSKTRTYGVISGGGRDNDISYNIIVDSDQSIGMQDRTTSLEDIKGTYQNGTVWQELVDAVGNGSSAYIKAHPEMLRLYQELNQGTIFYPYYNKITNNVIVNAADINYAGVIQDSPTTDMTGNYVGTDYSIFVDPDNQDFRVKKSAKAELGLDDGVLDEDFDINLIGMQREPIDIDKSFAKTYPRNGDTGLDAASITLSWQRAPFADEYDYVVATDPEFKNVVRSGTTIYSKTEITNLEKSTNYYWKVTAKNISRAFPEEWEASGAPYLFTTASYDVLTQDNLKAAIKKAQEYLPQIQEGTELGMHKEGTRAALEAQIASAQAIAEMTSGTQAMVNNAEKDIRDALATAQSAINVAYCGTIDTSPGAGWTTTMPDDCKITYEDGAIKVDQVTANGGIAASGVEIPGYGIYTFMMKATSANGWFAFSMRHSNIDSNNIYSAPNGSLSNYFYIVKEDVFELQSRNSESAGSTLMVTAENNGKFKNDEWNKIEMGAIPMGKGVLCILRVNDETIYEYLDEVNPIRTEGRFAIQPVLNNPVYIKACEDAPTGEFTPPDYIFDDAQRLPIDYTTESPEYTESGNWQLDTVQGFDNKQVRVTEEQGAYGQFFLAPAKEIRTYRVSYYHVPYADGDPAAQVSFSNLYTDYQKRLDMTKGEAGWRELGTFNFADAGAQGTMNIRFTASGQGKLPISAVRIEWVDESERLFSEVFTMQAKNGMLLKIGENIAYCDISPIEMDTPPVIVNERTLVPLRFVSEAFGARVDWDGAARTATILLDGKQIQFTADSAQYMVDGTAYTLDQPPLMENDRMLLPLRALSETALGKNVMWDPQRQLILIANQFAVAQEDIEAMLETCNGAYTE